MSDQHRTGCGCPVCTFPRTEYEARCMGEQGPDAADLEIDRLRARVAELEEALQRAINRCEACWNCGPARCDECKRDEDALTAIRGRR
jgi:hypothetical protein